jgi:transcriptional regulator with XRE-family HTH domain
MTRKPKGNGGSLKLYTSYNFVDKDPVIDKVRTLVKREGLKYSEISALSGVTTSTMHNWFEGKTRRPQYATVLAVVHALGYRSVFVRRGEKL